MKFKKQFEQYENAATPSGEKIVYEHREEIGKDGKRRLIKDKAINLYEYIQSSRESCEIETILRRAREGDPSILNAVNANYLDITDAPSSLAEAQQFVIRTKNEFENLPKEIKFQFDNSAEQYVAQYGTQKWADALGITLKMEEEKKTRTRAAKTQENFEKMVDQIAEKGLMTNEQEPKL